MGSTDHYCITTKRFTLRCRHPEWLVQTMQLYNQVVFFYYNLLLDQEEAGHGLMTQNSQQIMRSLEVLTIVGRDKRPVPYPILWEKLPLYFRRAAINAAISAVRAAVSAMDTSIACPVKRTEGFHCGVTFYKGMYQDLTEQEIRLKVWNGTAWIWMRGRLDGNRFPEECVCLSPALLKLGKKYFLDIPVREKVGDGRKLKERMAEHTKLCAVRFTNGDAFVVAVVLDAQGEQAGVRFFRGGDEYIHRTGLILHKIREAEQAMGGRQHMQESKRQPFNQKYWLRLKNISEQTAHRISRELVDYCTEQGAGILVLPEYDRRYTGCVMYSVGNWSPLHLSARIRRILSYKAWHSGILVLEKDIRGCGRSCTLCGESVKRRKQEYVCRNGHRGNYFVNSARNLGKSCIESLRKNL